MSHLHPFSGEEKTGRFDPLARKANGNPLCITLAFKFFLSFPPLNSAPCNQVSYQGIDVFHFHGPTVENVSAQDNKEEEKAQQHVAHIAEDVVEGTAGKNV